MASLIYRKNEAGFVSSVCAVILKGNWRILSNTHITTGLTTSNINLILLQLSPNTSLSWAFFKYIHSLPHYTPSLQPHWTMIHLLTKSKHFKPARELLEKMSHKEFISSPSVLNSLLNTHSDPDSNSQILSWLVILYARMRRPDETIQVFEQMKIHGLMPDQHACSALLNSLAKARLTATAWKVYGEMLRIGVVANTHIFNVMIHVCFMSGDAEKAEKLVEEMERKGVSLDLFSYNTLISLFCKKGMHYEALGVQERMVREGIRADIVTYNSLIHGFCREGRMREALRLFKEIKDAEPNLVM